MSTKKGKTEPKKALGPLPDSVIAGLFRTIAIDEQDVSLNKVHFLILFFILIRLNDWDKNLPTLEILMQEIFMRESTQMVTQIFLRMNYWNSCKITLSKM